MLNHPLGEALRRDYYRLCHRALGSPPAVEFERTVLEFLNRKFNDGILETDSPTPERGKHLKIVPKSHPYKDETRQ